jgi:glutathione peroxidase-family protein
LLFNFSCVIQEKFKCSNWNYWNIFFRQLSKSTVLPQSLLQSSLRKFFSEKYSIMYSLFRKEFNSNVRERNCPRRPVLTSIDVQSIFQINHWTEVLLVLGNVCVCCALASTQDRLTHVFDKFSAYKLKHDLTCMPCNNSKHNNNNNNNLMVLFNIQYKMRSFVIVINVSTNLSHTWCIFIRFSILRGNYINQKLIVYPYSVGVFCVLFGSGKDFYAIPNSPESKHFCVCSGTWLVN